MPTITRAKLCISLILFGVCAAASADWKVDFSRRTQEMPSLQETQELSRGPASADVPVEVQPVPLNAAPVQASAPGFFESLISPPSEAQEIVVLNTEKGFVPSTVRVKKGMTYQIHVVNVNDKEKNVSFVLDSFSEHQATFYGKIKTFTIRPQKEGVYKFVSPETAAQGKLVVYPSGTENRLPASE